MAVSSSDNMTTQSQPTKTSPQQQVEVKSVKCYSCRFTKDCTPECIGLIRARFQGRWLCGLCSEVGKVEAMRSDKRISVKEALERHTNICKSFKSSQSETEHPIFVMGRILRRSLDSPRAFQSNSSSVLPDIDKINNSKSLV